MNVFIVPLVLCHKAQGGWKAAVGGCERSEARSKANPETHRPRAALRLAVGVFQGSLRSVLRYARTRLRRPSTPLALFDIERKKR